ncbi:hypothetical protein TNCV_3751621 [Trichonephila clavipes]|nr:hypothetical protein TNCV_3751621 [Trichonephila clavipes]
MKLKYQSRLKYILVLTEAIAEKERKETIKGGTQLKSTAITHSFLIGILFVIEEQISLIFLKVSDQGYLVLMVVNMDDKVSAEFWFYIRPTCPGARSTLNLSSFKVLRGENGVPV